MSAAIRNPNPPHHSADKPRGSVLPFDSPWLRSRRAARPGTRALQLDADPDGTAALDVGDFRKRGLKPPPKDEDASQIDESMELYTDDAVAPRRRR